VSESFESLPVYIDRICDYTELEFGILYELENGYSFKISKEFESCSCKYLSDNCRFFAIVFDQLGCGNSFFEKNYEDLINQIHLIISNS
jgi:hypothetical protein